MNKKALVTGGSRGIGAETVRILTERGYDVAFIYKENDGAAMSVAEETGAFAFKCDVADKVCLKDTIKAAKIYLGTRNFDVVVCNAGISIDGLFSETTDEEWDEIMNINLMGAINTVRFTIDDMIREKTGSVIVVSSMWGETGGSFEVAYSTTKAGLIGFVKSLAKEVGPSGVRVNAVTPGVIDTDMCRAYDENVINGLIDDVPLKRIGKPRDIAETIEFLASDKSSYITGQAIGVSGGFYI